MNMRSSTFSGKRPQTQLLQRLQKNRNSRNRGIPRYSWRGILRPTYLNTLILLRENRFPNNEIKTEIFIFRNSSWLLQSGNTFYDSVIVYFLTISPDMTYFFYYFTCARVDLGIIWKRTRHVWFIMVVICYTLW
jgi:hypothetical protein